MKIFFSPRTAGRYGGRLKGDLIFLPEIIEYELNERVFKSSFDEFWLIISYPPMYVLPGVVGIEKDYKSAHDSLPKTYINRKSKKIEVTLQGSEFSEHFDKNDQLQYQHRFEIADIYKNISSVELAIILINKYIEAINLIIPKLTANDQLDIVLFTATLNNLKQKISPRFLADKTFIFSGLLKTNGIKRAVDLRNERKLSDKPKNTLIRDVRLYDFRLPKGAFYPYGYQYCEIFRNILRRKGFMCPVYHHLYIMAAPSFNEALQQSTSLEKWYMYGLTEVDYNEYLDSSDTKRESMAFDTIVSGLKDIVEIDKLDETIFNETVQGIRQKGLDTELEYKSLENKNHVLTFTYFTDTLENGWPLYLNLTNKNSRQGCRYLMGRVDVFQLHTWLQKISLTNTHIKIKSSISIAADVYLKKMPRTMEFDIKKLLNGEKPSIA
jgi:hypothetical protein